MSTTCPIPELSPEVESFLRSRDAFDGFHEAYSLAIRCFPDALRFDVTLQEDPDEQHRFRAVLQPMLPCRVASAVPSQIKSYHEEFVRILPPSKCELFPLVPDFLAD
jgi:hypothetical protein